MTLPVSDDLLFRWWFGQHVGAWRPYGKVEVRQGHFTRQFADDGAWEATWHPDTDFMELPGIDQIGVEQTFENNGIAVATFDVENVAFTEESGPGGAYHAIRRGWYSPLRSYSAPERPGMTVAANEWDRILGTKVELRVTQGYGEDAAVTTFCGLLDSVDVSPRPDRLRLSSRDFGGVLVDGDLFGWNIDPSLRNPQTEVTFWDDKRNRALETSSSASNRATGKRRRSRWVLVDDVSDMVRVVLRWAGFPPDDVLIEDTGARLKEPISFSLNDHFIDVIKKATDLTGFIFFIGGPTDDHPMGTPTFRRPRSQIATPPVATELRDDLLLTGLTWQFNDEPRASIYRVRGREEPVARGGVPLGTLRTPALLGLYRPPWHRQPDGTGSDRDARVLRHDIHIEPLYKTQQEVDVAVRMWALNSAIASVSATLEIPAYPALQLDDVVGAREMASGVNTRCWISRRSETMRLGRETVWTQSLGVSCLDDPDVVEIVADLHETLTGLPRGTTGSVATTVGPR